MGLDMYLTKVRSLYGYKINQDKLTIIENYKQSANQKKEIDTKDIRRIVYETGYWRKANHIHKWFVDNVQEGNDDCGEYYVSREQLEKLYDTCKKAIELRYQNLPKEKIEEQLKKLLPTQSGFFFGGTEYDEWYFGAIEETIEMIEKEKENKEDWEDLGEICYYYRSSW